MKQYEKAFPVFIMVSQEIFCKKRNTFYKTTNVDYKENQVESS